jgi:hypothetical protein
MERLEKIAILDDEMQAQLADIWPHRTRLILTVSTFPPASSRAK